MISRSCLRVLSTPRRGHDISAQGKRSAALGTGTLERVALKGRNKPRRCGRRFNATESNTTNNTFGVEPLLSRPFRAWRRALCIPRATLRLPWAGMFAPLRGFVPCLLLFRNYRLNACGKFLPPLRLGGFAPLRQEWVGEDYAWQVDEPTRLKASEKK
jgi:hypothetical protein